MYPTHARLVFVSPVSGLEKDQNWAGLDRKKTGLQSWSLIFKMKDRKKTGPKRPVQTGSDWSLVPLNYPFKCSQGPCKLMKD